MSLLKLSLQIIYCICYYQIIFHFVSVVSVSASASKKTTTSTQRDKPKFVELTIANLTKNFQNWEYDTAIMFYAPWCKYCKQLAPYMEQISIEAKTHTELVIGKFNCEEPKSHASLCQELGVTHYPSIFFVGYGNFNQAPAKNALAASDFPRLVQYRSQLLPDAIFDWVRMLHGISWAHRQWDDLWSIFFPSRSRTYKRIKALSTEISTLQKKVDQYKTAVEKYKANELFDSLVNKGDPFPLLNELPVEEVGLIGA